MRCSLRPPVSHLAQFQRLVGGILEGGFQIVLKRLCLIRVLRHACLGLAMQAPWMTTCPHL
jgi:hypothetical protein